MPRSPGMALLVVVLAACGTGFDSQGFATGAVEGRLSNPSGQKTVVFELGHPERAVEAAADGSFRLEGLPVGEHVLVASDSGGFAAKLTVDVKPAAVARPELPLLPAGHLLVLVKPQGTGSGAGAAVKVQGTPFVAAASEEGAVVSPPLPDDCWALAVEHHGYAGATLSGCLAGGKDAPVEVPLKIDPASAAPGCASAGCAKSQVCDPKDGLCYACLTTGDCGGSLVCSGRACVGAVPTCTACHTNDECGANGRCDSLRGAATDRYCSYRTGCTGDAECPYGFACDEARCRLDPDKVRSCGASSAVGLSCTNDDACTAAGLVNGLCRDGACTVSLCAGDGQCPAGYRCVNEGVLSLCRKP